LVCLNQLTTDVTYEKHNPAHVYSREKLRRSPPTPDVNLGAKLRV
jgi:hypothetical protein